MKARVRIPLLLLIGLQGLDVALHAATGQLETMRIASNAILCLGAITAAFAAMRVANVIVATGLIYLTLNVAFLAQHGFVNAATGAPRLPLFIFVGGSLLLLTWLWRRLKSTL